MSLASLAAAALALQPAPSGDASYWANTWSTSPRVSGRRWTGVAESIVAADLAAINYAAGPWTAGVHHAELEHPRIPSRAG